MKRRELSIKWTFREPIDAIDGYLPTRAVRGPADLAAYLAPWSDEAQEVLVVIAVDARMRVIGHREVGRGTAFSCPSDPAQVLRAALMSGGVAFFVAHNHPSGDTTPSDDDVKATARIRNGADAIGVTLLDHLVIGRTAAGKLSVSSLKELGLM